MGPPVFKPLKLTAPNSQVWEDEFCGIRLLPDEHLRIIQLLSTQF